MEAYYVGFVVLAVACAYGSNLVYKNDSSGKVNSMAIKGHISFRTNYLVIYTLVMASDWLQGPYIYDLYKKYGFSLEDIAMLFVVGFMSSAVFGSFAGSIADKYGRKLMAIAFCIIYGISCLTKLSSSYNVLLLGRLTGGIATSLLFSVFESWMVSEHNSKGLSEDFLSETFSLSTFYNGLVAIVSGIVANVLASRFGPVSPFMASFFLLILAGGLIQISWRENYGDQNPTSINTNHMIESFKIIIRNPNILYTGMIQCLFESVMYSFVFLWSPVLEKVTESGQTIPYGVIFSSFMVSIMIGSLIFRFMIDSKQTHLKIVGVSLLVAFGSTLVPCYFQSHIMLFIGFNLFELSCGIYFPVIGMLRGKFIPEDSRATIMTIFRIPLNLIVVLILTKTKTIDSQMSFLICSFLLLVAYWALHNLKDYKIDQLDSLDTPLSEMEALE